MDSDEEDTEDTDLVHLLDKFEALELIESDPTLNPKDKWNPPQVTEALQPILVGRRVSCHYEELSKTSLWGDVGSQGR